MLLGKQVRNIFSHDVVRKKMANKVVAATWLKEKGSEKVVAAAW
jgi:hypothetical protein